MEEKKKRNFLIFQKKEKKNQYFIWKRDFIYIFGFTPRIRIFYKHKVKDGLPSDQKRKVIDYAKAIFGYSSKSDDQKQKSYKSRVSFSDAVFYGGEEEQKEKA